MVTGRPGREGLSGSWAEGTAPGTVLEVCVCVVCVQPWSKLPEEHSELLCLAPQQTTGLNQCLLTHCCEGEYQRQGGGADDVLGPQHVTLSSCPCSSDSQLGLAPCRPGEKPMTTSRSHSCAIMNKWETFPIKIHLPPHPKNVLHYLNLTFLKKRFLRDLGVLLKQLSPASQS